MAKFRCIKGSPAIPVGTIIEGELQGKTIVLTEDSTVKDGENKPYFDKGEPVPLTGYIWQWEELVGPDKEELLARFESAVDVLTTYTTDILHWGESTIDHTKAKQEYESAKAEVLKRLS